MSGKGKPKTPDELADSGGLTVPKKSPYESGRRPILGPRLKRGLINRVLTRAQERANANDPERDPASPADPHLKEDFDPDRASPPYESGDRVVKKDSSGVIPIDSDGNVVGPAQFDSEGKISESGTAVDLTEIIADARKELAKYLSVDERVIAEMEERDLITLQRVTKLFEMGTLEGDEEAMRILEDANLVAEEQWDEVHPKRTHNLSENGEDRVNRFAKFLVENGYIKDDQWIVDGGSGPGNDTVYFAQQRNVRVTGIDSSEFAIDQANEYAKSQTLMGSVEFRHGKTDDVFEEYESQGKKPDGIHMHSSRHYTTARILREKKLPQMARVLRGKNPGEEPGKLYLGIKLATSASAKSANQLKLVPSDPSSPCFDLKDKMLRTYFADEEAVLEALALSFDVEYISVEPLDGYDQDGDVEMMCYIIATPKPEPEIPELPEELPEKLPDAA